MTKAQQAYDYINDQLAAGRTINIRTAIKWLQVTPKIAKQWQSAGRQLFKIGNDGCLYMARGKAYDCIAYQDMLLASISSQTTH